MLEVGSDFSGVGAFEQSLMRLDLNYRNIFSCDMDKYARKTFIENYGTVTDKNIVNSKEHDSICTRMIRWVEGLTVLSEQAVVNLLSDAEKLAKSFSFYYPLNVNHRTIPIKPLDIYMTSPPCQGFSIAGKREGSVLFYNSYDFIKKNKPRYFIFENVKGLLSHEGGLTFQTWIDYLGGKTVNGNPVIFPLEESLPYHVFHKVINAKDCDVPQNRERVFIIGVRDDVDNSFHWPKKQHLTKRLKNVLELEVDEKYYLSDKMIRGLITSTKKHEKKGTGFKWNPKTEEDLANCLRANAALCKTDNTIKVGYINQNTQASQVFSKEGLSPNICEGTHGYANGYLKIGAIRGRNPENPKNRKTGLDTVQKLEINENGTSNTLTTVQKDNVVVSKAEIIQLNEPVHSNDRIYSIEGLSPTLNTMQGGNRQPFVSNEYNIRRLTPRECFRLMDFPDTFKMPCSDSQMFKQAGNSIVVAVLSKIINKLNIK